MGVDDQLIRAIEAQIDRFRIGPGSYDEIVFHFALIAVIDEVERAPCVPALKGQFGAADPDVRAMAVAATLAHCDASVVGDIEAATASSAEVVAILAMHGQISAAEVRSRLAEKDLQVEDASYLLVALGAVGSGEDIEAIRTFVAQRQDTEEGVRIAAVLALHRLHAPSSFAAPFLNGIFESSKLALEWVVDVDPVGSVRLMREAVGRHNGETYVKFARRLPLASGDIEFLVSAVTSGDAAAAGIYSRRFSRPRRSSSSCRARSDV